MDPQQPPGYPDVFWAKLTPEQRAMVAQQWAAMTPEQQKAAQAKFGQKFQVDATNRIGSPMTSSPPPSSGIPGVGGNVRSGVQAGYNPRMPPSGTNLPSGGDAGMPAWVPKVGGWIKDNASWLVPTGLAVWDAVQRDKQDKSATALDNEAVQLARQQYADMAPIRAIGMQGLQNAKRPDLSFLADDPGNPYNRRRIPAVGGR